MGEERQRESQGWFLFLLSSLPLRVCVCAWDCVCLVWWGSESESGKRCLISSAGVEERSGWRECACAEDGEESVCDPNWLLSVLSHHRHPQQATGTCKSFHFHLSVFISLCCVSDTNTCPLTETPSSPPGVSALLVGVFFQKNSCNCSYESVKEQCLKRKIWRDWQVLICRVKANSCMLLRNANISELSYSPRTLQILLP